MVMDRPVFAHRVYRRGCEILKRICALSLLSGENARQSDCGGARPCRALVPQAGAQALPADLSNSVRSRRPTSSRRYGFWMKSRWFSC